VTNHTAAKVQKKMRTRIKDIAEEAGVSIGAVSQTLKGIGRISQRKRDEILKIAERVRYRPNLLIQSIQTGRTNTVGVLMSMNSSFHAYLFKGICSELDLHDCVPMTISGHNVDVDRIKFELAQLHRLIDRRVDGVIILSGLLSKFDSGEMLNEIGGRNIPIVAVDMDIPSFKADFVGVNDYEGGRLAARHLIGKGHKILCHLTPDFQTANAAQRRLGFAGEAERGGAKCVVMETQSYTKSDFIEPLVKLFSGAGRPTAVFCASDYMASDVYDAAREMSLRIPEDLSVMGFANIEIASHLTPGLTSVDQFPEKEGAEAVRLLLKRIDGVLPPEPQRVFVEPALVERGSVLTPRAGK
jgi:LacI family transcriptional regulator